MMKVTDHFLTQEIFELRATENEGIFKTFPVPENLDSYYDSKKYISHHQDSKGLKEKVYKFLQYFNLVYKKSILNSNLQKGGIILDYGFGAGNFLRFIENDFNTVGFEPNSTARSSAKQKLKKTAVIESLDEIENNSLDGITLWHVLEHIENQAEILELFHKKLKTNGLLIIAVPNFTSFDADYYKSFWAAYDVPRHLYHFSKAGMIKLMTKNRWVVKEIKPLVLDAFYISVLSEKYKKTPLFWFRGAIIGAISNFKAIKSGNFSSLIYVIQKK